MISLASSAVTVRVLAILVLAGCPHRDLAVSRASQAAANVGATVSIDAAEVVVLSSPEEAAASGFRGSPTFLIDGADPFPANGEPSWSCRLYPTDRGLEGSPSVTQLEEALRR